MSVKPQMRAQHASCRASSSCRASKGRSCNSGWRQSSVACRQGSSGLSCCSLNSCNVNSVELSSDLRLLVSRQPGQDASAQIAAGRPSCYHKTLMSLSHALWDLPSSNGLGMTRQVAALPSSNCKLLIQEQPWIYRVAGHLANAGTAAKRRLLQEVQPVTCASAGALVTGYGGCVYVTGEYPLPIPNKHFVHWTVDSANGGGVSFAVEVAPIGGGNSWAGLGWSPQGNPAHPPQMINATAVMGWVDIDNNPHVEVFDLWAKNVEYIQESYDQFTVTDTSIEYIQQNHLVLRFRRKFDTVFRPDVQQRMITAHGHRIRGLSQHGHRAALFMDASGQGSMRVTSTRLSNKKVQAHAWCMFIAFGIILPIGIIWARYFRDVWGKWYMLHLGIQAFGLLLAVAAFLVAVTQNNPIPRSLAHFQLGLAVIILAVLQPLNSLPRLTMHHGHVRRSIYWAYLHWLCGRVTIAFAWVNMFLGVGRYRTWFNLGSWPEGALGLYFGAIILVCTILESRLWRKGELRAREENDELSRRIAELENRTDYHSRRSPSEGKPLREEDDDDLLDQVTLRHNAPPLTGDSAAESTAKDDSDLDQVHPDSQDRLKKGNKVY